MKCAECGAAAIFKANGKWHCQQHAPSVEVFGQKIYIDDRVPRDLAFQYIDLEKWREAFKLIDHEREAWCEGSWDGLETREELQRRTDGKV